MMDSNIHTLPPLKRFRLQLQQEEPKDISPPPSSPPLSLPTKKRKESRNFPPINPDATTTICLPAKKRVWALPPPDFSPTNTAICLPAKKRVWALPPTFSPEKPNFHFDLNLEYDDHPTTIDIDEEAETSHPASESEIEKDQEGEISDGKSDGFDDDGIVCAVCGSTDGDPSDPIVFCDGCDLTVHVTCYGNPLLNGIPEEDWFCQKCLASNLKPPTHSCCCLCPATGGALKPTNDGRWAHLVCSLYVPEVFFADPDGRQGIDCSKVPKKRWKHLCYLCNTSDGCAIECSEPKCALAFHVTCGLREDLCFEYKQGRSGGGGAIVAGFCKKHTALWNKQQQTGKFKIVARDD